MAHENRLRAFAIMMIWMLRKYGGAFPPPVSDAIERAEEALRDGQETDIRAALEAMDPAFTAARRAARQQHNAFDANNFLQYAICAALAAVLIAIRADRAIALEAADADEESFAGRAVAGWEELDRTYTAAASCCRYAQLGGVARENLQVFQALLPSVAIIEED